MIATIVKWLLYIIIGLMIVGATSPTIVPLFILALCVRWLIKNRHNLTTGDNADND